MNWIKKKKEILAVVILLVVYGGIFLSLPWFYLP